MIQQNLEMVVLANMKFMMYFEVFLCFFCNLIVCLEAGYIVNDKVKSKISEELTKAG